MPEDGEGWGLGRARCLRPLSGFGVTDGGPQAADWRRHGFLMCVSDLLATGQPSEVKRVQPWGLADRVKGPGISDTSERMQLPLNQALRMDRQKTGPKAGLLPLLSDSPSREPCAPSDTDVVQIPRIVARPLEKGLPHCLSWEPLGEVLGLPEEEFPVCAQAGDEAYLHRASLPGRHKHSCPTDVETEAQPITQLTTEQNEVRLSPSPLGPKAQAHCVLYPFLSRKNFPSSAPEHFHPPVSPFPVQYLGIPMPLTLPYRNHSELPPKSMFIFWALEISCGTEQADAWPGKGGKDPGGLKVLRLT